MPVCPHAKFFSKDEDLYPQYPYPTMPCEWRKGVSYESFSPDCIKDETPDAYIVTFNVHGILREDIDVTISEGLIAIEGNYKGMPAFSTIREIPCDVEVEKVSATLKNGVLEVTFPKVKPLHIKVQ